MKVFIASLLLTTISLSAWAKGVSCSSTDLQQKDCLLKFKNYKIQFSAEKVLVHDGVWRSIHSLPLKGKKSEWHQVRVFKLAGRFLVEFFVWDPPQTTAEVQRLKWFVGELKGPKLNWKVEKIVQRRRRVPANAIIEEPQTLKDPRFSHGLKAINGKIHWWVDTDSGKF